MGSPLQSQFRSGSGWLGQPPFRRLRGTRTWTICRPLTTGGAFTWVPSPCRRSCCSLSSFTGRTSFSQPPPAPPGVDTLADGMRRIEMHSGLLKAGLCSFSAQPVLSSFVLADTLCWRIHTRQICGLSRPCATWQSTCRRLSWTSANSMPRWRASSSKRRPIW